MKELILLLAGLVTSSIDSFGNVAVFVLMALESANVPIPSEIILTYAGFMASKGILNIHTAALAGAAGCLIGSQISYYLGMVLGRPFLWKYGKWILISQKDLIAADKFILKYGDSASFISRLLPVVRTFISFVIGISKGNFWKFSFYTFIGSWIWSYLLIYVGLKLGNNWESIKPWWDRFSGFIILLILGAIIWHIVRAFKNNEKEQAAEIVK